MKKYIVLNFFVLFSLFAFSQTNIQVNYQSPSIPIPYIGQDTFIALGKPLTFMLEATITGGTFPMTYSWSPGEYLNDSTILNPLATLAPSITDWMPVVYKFKLSVTDSNECISQVSRDINIIYYGVNEINKHNIKLYPNPAKTKLYIEGLLNGTNEVQIDIYSLDGKLVYSKFNTNILNVIEIDVDNLSKQMYLLKLTYGGQEYSHKLYIH
jgi:hypothetical protein